MMDSGHVGQDRWQRFGTAAVVSQAEDDGCHDWLAVKLKLPPLDLDIAAAAVAVAADAAAVAAVAAAAAALEAFRGSLRG